MSKTLQNTIEWVNPILRWLPLATGNVKEPALTNANMVQQTILSAPFCWAWNRNTVTFNTVAGQQDYPEAVNDFGFIEKATVASGGVTVEISDKTSLSQDSRSGRPDFIAAQNDDQNGNITFRLMKVPDKVYAVTVTYQKKPPTFSSVTQTWAIPDQYQFIYSYGFLTLSLLHAGDPRMAMYNQKFISALLSANRGLTDMERNIFVGNWLALTSQEMSDQGRAQQGNQARGV